MILALALVACDDPVPPNTVPTCDGPVYTQCYTIDRACCETTADNSDRCWYEYEGVELPCSGTNDEIDCACALARIREHAGLCLETGDTGDPCG